MRIHTSLAHTLICGESQGRVRFCKQHRIKSKHVYLASKRCEFDECLRAASFGRAPSFKARFCALHKSGEDTHVKWRMCQHPEGCNDKALPRTASIVSLRRMELKERERETAKDAYRTERLFVAIKTHTHTDASKDSKGITPAEESACGGGSNQCSGSDSNTARSGGRHGVGGSAKSNDKESRGPYCKICHRRAISGTRLCPHLRKSEAAVPF